MRYNNFQGELCCVHVGLCFPRLCDLFFNDKSNVNNCELRKKKQTLLLLLHAIFVAHALSYP